VGAETKIEWCHATFNPWRGCAKVSAGCANCYAETMSGRNPKVLGVWGPNGTRVVAAEAQWREPLRWNEAAAARGERHRVFCASLADVFEDWRGPMVNASGERLFLDRMGAWRRGSENVTGRSWEPLTMDHVRERLFFLIRDTPNLDWLLLTKRPENILGTYGRLDVHDPDAVLPNLWLGTSVENQAAADERIPLLLQVPAKVRFLSMEPLLGRVNVRPYLPHKFNREPTCPWCEDCIPVSPGAEWWKHTRPDSHGPFVDWVIVGGESGPGARPMHPDWARSLRDQCQAAGVPFFMKQMGEAVTERLPLRLSRKGGELDEIPADLRVREFPDVG
jgi:protein gp37